MAKKKKVNKEMRNLKVAAMSPPKPKGKEAKDAARKEQRAMRAKPHVSGQALQDYLNHQQPSTVPNGSRQRGARGQQNRRAIRDQL